MPEPTKPAAPQPPPAPPAKTTAAPVPESAQAVTAPLTADEQDALATEARDLLQQAYARPGELDLGGIITALLPTALKLLQDCLANKGTTPASVKSMAGSMRLFQRLRFNGNVRDALVDVGGAAVQRVDVLRAAEAMLTVAKDAPAEKIGRFARLQGRGSLAI